MHREVGPGVNLGPHLGRSGGRRGQRWYRSKERTCGWLFMLNSLSPLFADFFMLKLLPVVRSVSSCNIFYTRKPNSAMLQYRAMYRSVKAALRRDCRLLDGISCETQRQC